jgi:hypothetical protein
MQSSGFDRFSREVIVVFRYGSVSHDRQEMWRVKLL